MGRGLLKLPGIRPILALASGALALLQAMTIIMQAKWLAQVITALFEKVVFCQGAIPCTAAVPGCFCCRYAISFWLQLVTSRYAEQTGTDLRRQMVEQWFRLGPRFAKTEGTGTSGYTGTRRNSPVQDISGTVYSPHAGHGVYTHPHSAVCVEIGLDVRMILMIDVSRS